MQSLQPQAEIRPQGDAGQVSSPGESALLDEAAEARSQSPRGVMVEQPTESGKPGQIAVVVATTARGNLDQGQPQAAPLPPVQEMQQDQPPSEPEADWGEDNTIAEPEPPGRLQQGEESTGRTELKSPLASPREERAVRTYFLI